MEFLCKHEKRTRFMHTPIHNRTNGNGYCFICTIFAAIPLYVMDVTFMNYKLLSFLSQRIAIPFLKSDTNRSCLRTSRFFS